MSCESEVINKEFINYPHVGESGGCDGCKLGLTVMVCEEELRWYEEVL